MLCFTLDLAIWFGLCFGKLALRILRASGFILVWFDLVLEQWYDGYKMTTGLEWIG